MVQILHIFFDNIEYLYFFIFNKLLLCSCLALSYIEICTDKVYLIKCIFSCNINFDKIYAFFCVIFILLKSCWFYLFLLKSATRRYGSLRGPTSSSCGGLWPLAGAFLPFGQKKSLICCNLDVRPYPIWAQTNMSIRPCPFWVRTDKSKKIQKNL